LTVVRSASSGPRVKSAASVATAAPRSTAHSLRPQRTAQRGPTPARLDQTASQNHAGVVATSHHQTPRRSEDPLNHDALRPTEARNKGRSPVARRGAIGRPGAVRSPRRRHVPRHREHDQRREPRLHGRPSPPRDLPPRSPAALGRSPSPIRERPEPTTVRQTNPSAAHFGSRRTSDGPLLSKRNGLVRKKNRRPPPAAKNETDAQDRTDERVVLRRGGAHGASPPFLVA
jgi:hypothetical protein